MTKNKTRVLSVETLKSNKVVNANDQDLGEIKEIMIDVDTGRIAYAVLSFGGGILDLGNKLFAVPWEALNPKKDKHEFVLNVKKELLENAQGFDKDNWPDMTSTDWGQKIFDHFGYKPHWK